MANAAHLTAFLALFAALLTAPAPSDAADPRCERAMHAAAPADVVLRVDHAEVAYDFTREREDLLAIVHRHGSADASARMSGRRVHGLTHSSLSYQLQASFQLQSLHDGTWCLWPRTTQADLGYSDTTVYVARDYPPGTCAFDAVRAHEAEHVAINIAVVDTHAPRLRTAMKLAARQGFPLAGRNPATLKVRAKDMLDAKFQDALGPLLSDRTRRNAAIDTETSYRALNAQCDRW